VSGRIVSRSVATFPLPLGAGWLRLISTGLAASL
jgi:hypothetical protein